MSYKTAVVWDCATCDSPNWRNMTSDRCMEHMLKKHVQCKCGRWFIGIEGHFGSHKSDSKDHAAVKEMKVPAMKSREAHVWVADPSPEPEAVERVPWIGFRCWRVYPSMPILMPLNATNDVSEWMPGRTEHVAVCRDRLHSAPHPSCKCGFWGLNDLWEAIGRNPPSANGILFHYQVIKEDLGAPLKARPLLVAGAIELSGRLIRGSDGARGEKAKLLALWPVMNELVEAEDRQRIGNTLERLYKVPVAATWEYLNLLADERRVLYAAADAVEPVSA